MKKILLLTFIFFSFAICVDAYQIDSPDVDKFVPSRGVKVKNSVMADKLENTMQRARLAIPNNNSSSGNSRYTNNSGRNNYNRNNSYNSQSNYNNRNTNTTSTYTDYTKYSGASSSAWN